MPGEHRGIARLVRLLQGIVVKIEKVSASVLAARSESPLVFGIGKFDQFSMVLVEVTSDEGVIGLGEAISRRGAAMTAEAVESLLTDVVVGEDPRNVEGLWVRMVEHLRKWGHTAGVVMEAISGIDIALWDLAAKSYGIPVWQLLAGAGRSSVPCYASSVYIADVDTMCSEALEQKARGFQCLKVKIGRSANHGGMAADIAALTAIRETVGPEMSLVVDANGAYQAAEASRVATSLDKLDIRWFEEPVPPDDVEGYRRLRSTTAVPLARGETDFGVFTLGPVIAERLIDVVQPDVARCGGITGARQLAYLTYAANLAFAPHTGFSGGVSQLAALHVAAAAPTLYRLEYMFIDNPLREIFVSGYPVPVDGVLEVPTGPGLGYELDRGKVDRYRVH